MLSNEDKAKIIELRRQNFTYKAIRAETGFALQTISDVIKGDKDKNLKGEEEDDLNKNVEDDFLQDGVVSFDSSIDKAKKIMVDINSLIKNGDLQEGDRREWAKRLDDLLGVIRVEMDDRIVEEITEAIAKRDDEWRNAIAQGYVEKGVVTNLANTINEKDVTIENFRNEIAQKDATIINKQDEIVHLQNSHQLEIENLNGQLGNLSWRIQGLNSDNWKMHNIIQNHSDNYERREQAYKKRDGELNEKEVKLEKSQIEVDKEFKEIARINRQQTEQAEKLTKRENEFNKQMNQVYDELNIKIKLYENSMKNLQDFSEKIFRQIKELEAEKKKIDDYKENQIREIKQYKEKQMEEIKNEKEKMSKDKEKIEKTKGELKAGDQRLRKMERTLKKIFGYYGYSNIYKSFSNNDQVGIKDQETTEDKKFVVLRYI